MEMDETHDAPQGTGYRGQGTENREQDERDGEKENTGYRGQNKEIKYKGCS
jgi:hypothetical protein